MDSKKKYLHLVVVFKASNLNYGEGVGNILALKKLTSGGKNYSYISRQAIRYDIVRMLNEAFDFELTDVDKKGGVIQFAENATIEKFPEIDLFGYMKTSDGNKIRKAVVRLTDGISLEPFNNELEFATNKGLADRIPQNEGNDIFQAEIHQSFYSYTITSNLDEIGKDTIYKIDLSNEEKNKRMQSLLQVIKLLYRDIRGKRENLAPVFILGGLYDSGNPFFYNRIKLTFTKDKTLLDTGILNDVLSTTTFISTVKEQTFCGALSNVFTNISELDIEVTNIESFFGTIMKKIEEYYN